MMPSPLAPPAGSPAAPAAPAGSGAPATPASPFGDGPGASADGDFSGLLALLAGVLSPPAPPAAPCPGPPAFSLGGDAVGDGASSDATRPAADAGPASLEVLVSALAQQASGLSGGGAPSVATPAAVDRPRPGPTGPVLHDTSPAMARLIGHWAAASPSGSGDPSGTTAADHGTVTAPPDPVAPATPSALPTPVESGSPDGNGSPVAALAHRERPDGHGSAVAALAHADRVDGTRPAVAELARQPRDGAASRSAVAELAQQAGDDAAGSPVAVLAHDDARARTSHRPDAQGDGTNDAPPAAISSDLTAAVRSTVESGASGPSGESGPSAVSSRRSPTGDAGNQTAALSAPGPAPARPTEVVTAPADAPAAATPAAVADQIVSAVVPLHGRGDGRHAVTLELRPEELGTIRVEVSVEHQTVHLTLHAADPATGRLLAAALPELRTALTDAGLTAGQLGVGGDGGHGAGQRRTNRGEGDADAPGLRRRHARLDGPTRPETARPLRPAPAGRLDLFL